MGLSRRQFLGLGAAALGLYVAAQWRFGDPKAIILAILRRRVSFLNIDPASFDLFAGEYVNFRKSYERELRLLAGATIPLRFVSPYPFLPQGNGYRRLVDSVVSMFLLSTDFFHNGADEKRRVSYTGFYDPYVSVCRNPFYQAAD